MALANLADARRYLPGVTVEDATLQPLIDASEEWVKEWAHANWDESGPVTENFYQVRAGSRIKLKDHAPSNVVVSTYLQTSSTAAVLSATTGYRLQDNGYIQLRPLDRGGRIQGLRPEELDAYSSDPLVYSRIEVAYDAAGVVPKSVTEAVAIIAAARFTRSAAEISGIQSESLGDYSYTMKGKDAQTIPGIPESALVYLAPFKRTRHAVSV